MDIDFHPNYDRLSVDKFKMPSEDYESPIKMYIGQMVEQLEKAREDEIIHTIHEQYAIDVNKEELIKALNYDRDQYNKGFQAGYERARTNFSPKQGEWIDDDYIVGYTCSVCGSYRTDAKVSNFKFCPDCGADMRGAK